MMSKTNSSSELLLRASQSIQSFPGSIEVVVQLVRNGYDAEIIHKALLQLLWSSIGTHREILKEYRQRFVESTSGKIRSGDLFFPCAHVAAFELAELLLEEIRRAVLVVKVPSRGFTIDEADQIVDKIIERDGVPNLDEMSGDKWPEVRQSILIFWDQHFLDGSAMNLSSSIEIERTNLERVGNITGDDVPSRNGQADNKTDKQKNLKFYCRKIRMCSS